MSDCLLAQRHGVANSDQTSGGLDCAEDAYAAPMVFRAGPEHAEIPGKVTLCQGRRHAPEGGLHAVDPQSRTDRESAPQPGVFDEASPLGPGLDVKVWPEAAPVDRCPGLQSA